MIRWAFSARGIMPLDTMPIALLLPLPDDVSLIVDTGHRRLQRRKALSVLATAALGIDGKVVGLTAGPDGRRRIAGTGHFASVAWRPGWVAAAISQRPIGIDIEQVEEAAEAADIARAGVDPGVDAVGYGIAGLWAAREAALKAYGRDLTRDHISWHVTADTVRGGGDPPLRLCFATRPGIVATVAYAGG